MYLNLSGFKSAPLSREETCFLFGYLKFNNFKHSQLKEDLSLGFIKNHFGRLNLKEI